MKNLSLILNGVLGIAVAVLYFLHFSNTNSSVKNTEGEAETTEEVPVNIAYVDADTLLSKYDFFDDLKTKLEEKGKKYEQEYKNRAEGLQKEFNEFQRNAQNLTINQAKALQDDLLKKEQNLRMYQEGLNQQLLQDEAKMNKELYDKVSEYLEQYGKDNSIQMVVKYNRGSDVLFAQEGMDITDKVIQGLNESYNSGIEADSTTVE